jgi:arsenite methyltransferase
MSVPFPHWFTWPLDNPARALLLAPRAFADHLPLRPADRVLEVGLGSGRFSAALARRVPQGHLDLRDVQHGMLRKSRRRLAAAGVANAACTVADAGGPLPFPPGSFDAAVLASVLGEVGDPAVAIDALGDLLRASGTPAIREHLPDPDMIGLARLRRLVGPRGFVLVAVRGPRWNSMALFQRGAHPVAVLP